MAFAENTTMTKRYIDSVGRELNIDDFVVSYTRVRGIFFGRVCNLTKTGCVTIKDLRSGKKLPIQFSERLLKISTKDEQEDLFNELLVQRLRT